MVSMPIWALTLLCIGALPTAIAVALIPVAMVDGLITTIKEMKEEKNEKPRI